MAEPRAFAYVAVDSEGRKVRGVVEADDASAAFARLRQAKLHPLKLKPAVLSGRGDAATLRPVGFADFLFELAALLNAGADIRTALGVLADGAGDPRTGTTARRLAQTVSGGAELDRAFASVAPRSLGFVPGLVAAGTAAGDLPGALEHAAELIRSEAEGRRRVVEAATYPALVLAAALVAVLFILVFVVPAIAPLAQSAAEETSWSLRLLLWASDGLLAHGWSLAAGTLVLVGGLLAAIRAGLLVAAWDRFLLDGPVRGLFRPMTFGGYALGLGRLLTAGVPAAEAMTLSTSGARSRVAGGRLAAAAAGVRRGEPVSEALSRVTGFPRAIVRLAAVGEQAGRLGPMLERGGRLERERAVRNLERATRALGPTLVILLGGLVGLVMAALLSGVASLGDAVLR